MTKIKTHHIFNIEIKIICMDKKCLKNYLQMVLNGKKSNFDEKFIKNCDKSIKGYILKIDIKYLNNLPGY